MKVPGARALDATPPSKHVVGHDVQIDTREDMATTAQQVPTSPPTTATATATTPPPARSAADEMVDEEPQHHAEALAGEEALMATATTEGDAADGDHRQATEESIWTRIQAAGVTLPPEVIDKLAELDLELSEGRGKDWIFFFLSSQSSSSS